MHPQSPMRSASWVGLFLIAWLASAVISLKLISLPGYLGDDVSHYKYWTRVVLTEGIQEIYHGEYPQTYSIYPPVTLYAYGLAGRLYQRLARQELVENPWDMNRMLASHTLSYAIKGVSVAFHLALGAGLFGLIWALYSVRVAALGSAFYLLNPAVLFDVAYWGAPDAAHSLFAVMALGLTLLGWWQSSWVSAGLAAMTKPQAWALVPIYLVAQFRLTGLMRILWGAGIAAITVLVIVMPFIVHGRLADFLTLPDHIASVMPVASANAHNLWWIVTRNPAPVVMDDQRFLGPLTYRLAALPLVLGVAGFTLWRLLRSPSSWVFLLAGYQAFGWFCFTTQAHENHSFFVLPLLLMAAPVARVARFLFGLISFTLLANMVLHDPAIIDRTLDLLDDASRYDLQIANAWLNLLIFFAWTGALLWLPSWCGEDSRQPTVAQAESL
jgi:hypothetical protein